MDIKDKPKFCELVVGTGETYDKPVTELQLRIWWNALSKFDWLHVKQAFNKHVMTGGSGKYMPRPADIVEMIEGNADDRATIAWGVVLDTLLRIGTYESVVFDDPIIHMVIKDMGGWIKVGEITEAELPFRAKDFAQRYKAYSKYPMTNVPPVMVGATNHSLSLYGKTLKPPVLIGEREKCLAISGSDQIVNRLELLKEKGE